MGLLKSVGTLWKNRKLIKAALKAVDEVMNMNNSIKSTEFMLNLVSVAGTFWAASQGFIPKELALKIGAGLVIGYTVCRSAVKLGQVIASFTKTDKDDKAIAAVTQVLDKIQETFKVKEPTSTQTVNVTTPPAPPAS